MLAGRKAGGINFAWRASCMIHNVYRLFLSFSFLHYGWNSGRCVYFNAGKDWKTRPVDKPSLSIWANKRSVFVAYHCDIYIYTVTTKAEAVAYFI